MKKIISLLLCVALLSTILVGCGGNDVTKDDENDNKIENNEVVEKENKEDKEETKEDDKTNDKEEKDTTDDKQEVESVKWETRDIEVPKIADIKKEVVNIPNTDLTSEIAETPFNYDVNEFKKVFDKSKFINDTYVLGMKKAERVEGETYKQGDFESYEISEAVVGSSKEHYADITYYFNDLEATLKYNSSRYKNPSEVYFAFNDLEVSKEIQKEIYNVLEDCIGAEYAEFLVYGLSTNDEYDMSVDYKTENATYTFKRSIYQSKYTKSIEFKIYISDYNIKSSTTYFDNGHFSFYDEEFKYDIGTFAPEIGSFSPSLFSTFGKPYFEKIPYTYVRTILDFASYDIIKTDDGKEIYNFSIEAIMGCSDMANIAAPDIDFDYKIMEKDGKIVYFDLTMEGGPGHVGDNTDELAAYKELSQKQLDQIKSVFPNIDVSGINLDEITADNRSMSTNGMIDLFDNTHKFEVSIASGHTFMDTYNGEWKVTITTPISY